jgi:uncharacterized LabA/DUF88 family protein
VSESSTERRIALFVDFENLVTNTGITAANFNLQPSLDRLLEKGKIIFRRAYCDWSRFQDAKAHLHEFGVELVDVPPSTRAGKNGADMRLVIDALELNYARHHIDTFVIASGDSDFCPLAYKLRENDKFVIGLAVKEATSPFFVKACDEFIYLKSDGRRSEPRHRRSSRRDGPSVSGDASTAESTSSTTPPSSGVSSGSTTSSSNKRAPREIPLIAREVVASLLSRATGPINPSLIKETIVRKEPDFDEREAGFSTFSRLLEAMEREGLCTRLQQGRQWYVTSKEGAPEAKDAKLAKTPESLETSESRHFDEEDEIPDPPDHAD